MSTALIKRSGRTDYRSLVHRIGRDELRELQVTAIDETYPDYVAFVVRGRATRVPRSITLQHTGLAGFHSLSARYL